MELLISLSPGQQDGIVYSTLAVLSKTLAVPMLYTLQYPCFTLQYHVPLLYFARRQHGVDARTFHMWPIPPGHLVLPSAMQSDDDHHHHHHHQDSTVSKCCFLQVCHCIVILSQKHLQYGFCLCQQLFTDCNPEQYDKWANIEERLQTNQSS